MANSRRGVSLVELLVVLGIIGLLVQLLLPAIQAGRESARTLQCANNLRQVGVGCLSHESAHGHLPTGGWFFDWVGDADRGFGIDQPGGWIYNILPFIEEDEIRAIGRGLNAIDKRQSTRDLQGAVVSMLNCPSRRTARVYPTQHAMVIKNGVWPNMTGRTDYAANAGDFHTWIDSPPSLEVVDSGKFRWQKNLFRHTGLVYSRSRVQFRQITDGTSKTYLVGEKYLDVSSHNDGSSHGDDFSICQGHDYDLLRWTMPAFDLPWGDVKSIENHPRQDARATPELVMTFGSSHSAGWYACRADGSVGLVAYGADPTVHRAAGNRSDSQAR